MNRGVLISLVIVAVTAIIPLTLYFVLPDPEPPADAPSQEERAEVIAMVSQAADELPDVTFTRLRTTDRRVVVVEARWVGPVQPERGNPEAWNLAADEIAEVIAESYLPAGWQVNVHLYRTRFQLMGVAGRPSALDGPEGWLRLDD
ncbi:MAG: hypothetical protein GX161_08100 [Firmicutes bacterium]|nr:hypothetical protein [Bacillota bacterium]